MKVKKFETVYKFARQYTIGKMAGSDLKSQKTYDTNAPEYRRQVYLNFRQEVLSMLGVEIDRNAWVFDQNELKTKYDGKETLKSLCETFYCNNVASVLAHRNK